MNTPHVAPAQTQQQIAWIGGSVHRVVLDGTATDNRLAVFRSTMRSGAASPVHVHDRDDETIVVLSGSGIFWAGSLRWDLGAGDAVYLPRSVPHSYLVTSDTEILTICNPAGVEEFFRAVGWDLEEPQPQDWAVDMEKLHAVGEAGGQHVLGPPLAAGDEMPAHYLAHDDR